MNIENLDIDNFKSIILSDLSKLYCCVVTKYNDIVNILPTDKYTYITNINGLNKYIDLPTNCKSNIIVVKFSPILTTVIDKLYIKSFIFLNTNKLICDKNFKLLCEIDQLNCPDFYFINTNKNELFKQIKWIKCVMNCRFFNYVKNMFFIDNPHKITLINVNLNISNNNYNIITKILDYNMSIKQSLINKIATNDNTCTICFEEKEQNKLLLCCYTLVCEQCLNKMNTLNKNMSCHNCRFIFDVNYKYYIDFKNNENVTIDNKLCYKYGDNIISIHKYINFLIYVLYINNNQIDVNNYINIDALPKNGILNPIFIYKNLTTCNYFVAFIKNIGINCTANIVSIKDLNFHTSSNLYILLDNDLTFDEYDKIYKFINKSVYNNDIYLIKCCK